MPTVFYPLDAAFPMSPAVLKDKNALGHFVTQRIPVVSTLPSLSMRWAHGQPCVELEVDIIKRSGRSASLRLHSQVMPTKPSHRWGYRADIALSLTSRAAFEVKKLTVTGKPSNASPEEMKHHLACLHDALAAIFSHASQIPEIDSDITDRYASDTGAIAEMIGNRVAQDIRNQKAKKDSQAQQLSRRAEVFSALPDGTPLQLRRVGHRISWQLALKYGRLDKQVARHARLLPLDTLRSDEIKETGLSAHEILPLFAAAKKAHDEAPTEALDFAPTKGTNRKLWLNTDAPIHPSFYDSPEAKERRSNGPKIWVQTSFPHHIEAYDAHGGTAHSAQNSHFAMSHPCFPRQDSSTSSRIPPLYRRSNRLLGNPKPLEDFTALAGIYIISRSTISILREHNIGGTRFVPIRVEDKDGKLFADDWSAILMREAIDCVQTARLDPQIKKSLNNRGVLPYEIAIHGDAPGDLDFWYDPALAPNAFFFSDRLRKALKKAGVNLKLGLKPVDVL